MEFEQRPNATKPHTIETVTGAYVDVSNPDPKTISIGDIGWALSRQSRFAGHTNSPEIWSVGQHSIFVVDLLRRALSGLRRSAEPPHSAEYDKKNALTMSMMDHIHQTVTTGTVEMIHTANILMGGLVHDGSEAYLIDLPTPVKRHPTVSGPYKELERQVQGAIYDALALRPLTEVEEAMVKWADMAALRIEAWNMMPSRGREWGITEPVLLLMDMQLMPVVTHWTDTYTDFINLYAELKKLLDEENKVN